MNMKLRPGSYSEGTLKVDDLIQTALDALDTVPVTRIAQREIDRIIERTKDSAYFETEEAAEDYDVLCDFLDARCPQGHYWGGHEGDPACVGVWPSADTDVWE